MHLNNILPPLSTRTHIAGMYADLVAAVMGISVTFVVLLILTALMATGYCLIRKNTVTNTLCINSTDTTGAQV